MRKMIAIALLAAVACVAAGEDKDPIKEKLFAAKVAYDKEMRQLRKQVTEWFDKQEEAARKAGDKKRLDQIKEDRKAYEENSDLPKDAPYILQQKHPLAKKKLETAYAEAIKAYTKAKKDDLATAVEKEWDEVSGKNKAIDLLALVDPKVHSVFGDWQMNKKSLICAANNTTTAQPRLQFPYEPGEEYNIEVTVRRLEGNEGFGIGLVAGGQQLRALVDAYPPIGYKTGLELLDKKYVSSSTNPTTVSGALLKADKENTILCSVRREKIEISVNGKLVTSYQGEFDKFSLPPTCTVPNKKALFLAVRQKTSYQIDRAVVTPVKGKGTILK